MEQIIYKNIMFASFAVMYAYGLFSFLTQSPEGNEYSTYKTSRKIYGATMIMWASFLVIHWHFNLRLNNPLLASTLCLCCFFPGVMLLEMTFSSLISSSYPMLKRLKITIINTIFVVAIVLVNYIFSPPSIRLIVLYAMSALFTVEMVILSTRFLKIYRKALKRADNYYSDNIDVFIRWMPNSIYISIIFGFAGSVLFFASNGSVALYMLGGLLLFTYIFISLQNYMINITKLKELLLNDNSGCVTTEADNNIENQSKNSVKMDRRESKRIETMISKWIVAKGFCKQGLTIEELALEFGTNRTYLSQYINSTYNLSFREWIASHRIEYSKILLLSNENLQSNRIAEMVGYSPNAFITIFSKSENMTPVKWRNANFK